jgi:predicted enzyme related to lactoylglutathione lyase
MNLNFLICSVIYTDKLDEVREFYQKHFRLTMEESVPHSFLVMPFSNTALEYIDAAWAGVAPSQGLLFRYRLPLTALEHERLAAEGVQCGELTVEPWGGIFGAQVQYFTITDPSGTRLQIFEDHFGEVRQMMTTADGTANREAQLKHESVAQE